MKSTFFVALISLAAFIQAAPTPQPGLLPNLSGVGANLTPVQGLTGGLGSNTAQTGTGVGGAAPAADGGLEARSTKGPVIWKRQDLNPGGVLAALGGVSGTQAGPAALLSSAVTPITGAGGNPPPAAPAPAAQDEA